MRIFVAFALAIIVGFAADVSSTSNITFHKDVEPILQRNCQSCHRPGQIGPMSLLSYEEARPWAKAIKSATSSRKMPPWFADPKYGHFSNDRSLKPAEIDTIAKWVDAGARKGGDSDAPTPVAWPAEGWRIQPDHIVKGGVYRVPKSGILPWTYVKVPMSFKEDTWVTSMEMRPGKTPAALHHYCIIIVPHTEDAVYNVFSPSGMGGKTKEAGNYPFEGCYEKGQEEFDYRPLSAGRLIPANSDMVFQMHYNTNGKDEIEDQPQVGFTIAKEVPKNRYVFLNVGGGTQLNINPYEGNYQGPGQEAELLQDVKIMWLQMHAHLRAKEFTFRFFYPDGREEIPLKVKWDPYWQTVYYPTEPLVLPKGTRLYVDGIYDNSANNPFNPDPGAPVKFGDQYTDEMMFPTYGVVVPASIDPEKVPIFKPSYRAGRDFTVVEKPAPASATAR
jgi:hypothetical protein